MKFKITFEDDAPSQVSILKDGQIYQAPSTHPSFTTILARLATNSQDESVVGLFDPQTALNEVFQAVSPRVSVVNSVVLFDGDPLHSAVANHILRFVEEGAIDRASAAAAFTEKVMRNPSENSREQLFSFLDANKFTITPEGDFVGYKAVFLDEEGVGISSRNAPARDGVRVDGVLVDNAPVRNLPGAVVTMPRSNVADNSGVACSTGLHVGTDSYARWFLGEKHGHVLEVHVDPVDVVSVPTDHDSQKIRVCRYTVVDVVEKEYTTAVLPDAASHFSPIVGGYYEWSLYFDDLDEDSDCEYGCDGGDEDPALFEEPVREPKVGDKVRFKVDRSRYSSPVEIGSEGVINYLPGDYSAFQHENFYVIAHRPQHNSSGNYFAREDFDLVDEVEIQDVTKAEKWDTRQNYTRQRRFPKGHAKAGQFIPKNDPNSYF